MGVVLLGHPSAGMAERFCDDDERRAVPHHRARVGVPQLVQSDAFKLRSAQRRLERPLILRGLPCLASLAAEQRRARIPPDCQPFEERRAAGSQGDVAFGLSGEKVERISAGVDLFAGRPPGGKLGLSRTHSADPSATISTTKRARTVLIAAKCLKTLARQSE